MVVDETYHLGSEMEVFNIELHAREKAAEIAKKYIDSHRQKRQVWIFSNQEAVRCIRVTKAGPGQYRVQSSHALILGHQSSNLKVTVPGVPGGGEGRKGCMRGVGRQEGRGGGKGRGTAREVEGAEEEGGEEESNGEERDKAGEGCRRWAKGLGYDGENWRGRNVSNVELFEPVVAYCLLSFLCYVMLGLALIHVEFRWARFTYVRAYPIGMHVGSPIIIIITVGPGICGNAKERKCGSACKAGHKGNLTKNGRMNINHILQETHTPTNHGDTR